jgi:hypothetical protein
MGDTRRVMTYPLEREEAEQSENEYMQYIRAEDVQPGERVNCTVIKLACDVLRSIGNVLAIEK